MRKSGEEGGVAVESGEIVVGRSLSVAKRVFLVLECALGLFILWSMLLNRQNVGWYPVELPFFYWLAVVMGVYWIAHGGWLLYTGLSPIPQIETGLDGVRLFCLVRFSTPWENIQAIEPASTAYIGPGRNVLPGNILPYGAHARFRPPISRTRRYVSVELADPGKVTFDSPLHRLVFRFQMFKNLYKYNLKHCPDPEAVTLRLQARWRDALDQTRESRA